MFEKVNPGHPDKMADRLAGAVVDLVYERAGGLTKANPRVACEVMAGHGRVDVQIETSLGRMELRAEDIDPLIRRLFGERVVQTARRGACEGVYEPREEREQCQMNLSIAE